MHSYRLIYLSSLITSLLVLSFLVFFSSEAEFSEGSAPAGPEFLAAKYKEPEGPIPAMLESSGFESEVGGSEYPPAEAPAGPAALSWDFSTPAAYRYDYSLSAKIDSSVSTTGQQMVQNVSSKGLMLIKVRKDQKADLLLQDLKLEIKRKGRAGQPPASARQELPDKTVKDISKDGTPSKDSGEVDISIEIMIRMPSQTLAPGESQSIAMEAPLRFGGKSFPVTGTDTVSLDKFVTINGHRCAKLVHQIDMQHLKVPEDLEGTYMAQIVGKGVVYFDMEDGRLVEGKLALLTSSRVEASPRVPESSKNAAADLPDKVRMVMDADNLVTLATSPKTQ